ncbi:MAG: cupin-like domain-containing protein [Erythrobacter sp.]
MRNSPSVEDAEVAALPETPIERMSSRDYQTVREYFRTGPDRPVIFTDAMEDWPARKSWTFDRLANQFGADLGLVPLGFLGQSGGLAMMLGEFIRKMDDPSCEVAGFWVDQEGRPINGPQKTGEELWSFIWNAFAKHPELEKEIGPSPQGMENGLEKLERPVIDALQKATDNSFHLFIVSSKGTTTPWHFDFPLSIASLSQFAGRKRVYLMRRLPGDGARITDFNPENPDFEKFPHYEGRLAYSGTLEPGEMLIVPRDFWHYVRSLTHCITMSYNFFTPETAVGCVQSILEFGKDRLDPCDRQIILDAFEDVLTGETTSA